ncbi:lipopolysaccharide heptosyltransferase II [Lentisalinibacter orientalis]|uniref:lipopolysaccharide heptosyltransferase II n=1 Tax=Lentisalinibacter orientalis TaxID=2992241 RepID=UPI003864A41F
MLVVGPSWVGDMVMAQSLFRLLAARHQGVSLDVLAPGWSLPILARMPEVREAVEMPAGHGELRLGGRRRLGRELRARGYARAIVLPRSLKAALVPWFARIPRRTGFRGEHRYGLINDMRPFDAALLDQTVKRFVALGLEPGEPLPDVLPRPRLRVDAERQAQAMARLGLDPTADPVAFMPGAEYGPAKCWPLEYYAELAARLTDRGHAVWVFGSAKDAAAARTIAGAAPVQDLCGRTSLEEAIDLLAACRAGVTNDSGLMHVAAAVGLPVAALYGSSSPAFTPPLTDRAVVHYLGLECSPCFERECPLGHFRCMREITPEDVLASLVELAAWAN